jgi:hypothetical protein
VSVVSWRVPEPSVRAIQRFVCPPVSDTKTTSRSSGLTDGTCTCPVCLVTRTAPTVFSAVRADRNLPDVGSAGGAAGDQLARCVYVGLDIRLISEGQLAVAAAVEPDAAQVEDRRVQQRAVAFGAVDEA